MCVRVCAGGGGGEQMAKGIFDLILHQGNLGWNGWYLYCIACVCVKELCVEESVSLSFYLLVKVCVIIYLSILY